MTTIYLLCDLLSENNTESQTDKKILPGNLSQVNPDNLHPKHGVFGVKECPKLREINFIK